MNNWVRRPKDNKNINKIRGPHVYEGRPQADPRLTAQAKESEGRSQGFGGSLAL